MRGQITEVPRRVRETPAAVGRRCGGAGRESAAKERRDEALGSRIRGNDGGRGSRCAGWRERTERTGGTGPTR
ncbi:hypothetical protein GLE_2277 [Lysobacter enzymogenes]|uniref:Uncharacterized protein n=1 Tax=Lysobacter enzymogenes TaxID=69 RepID=A0A0S2DGF4_LYSEN|nr:hypothetical protein GLE_2277 [Lysobacter enzymogenes]